MIEVTSTEQRAARSQQQSPKWSQWSSHQQSSWEPPPHRPWQLAEATQRPGVTNPDSVEDAVEPGAVIVTTSAVVLAGGPGVATSVSVVTSCGVSPVTRAVEEVAVRDFSDTSGCGVTSTPSTPSPPSVVTFSAAPPWVVTPAGGRLVVDTTDALLLIQMVS